MKRLLQVFFGVFTILCSNYSFSQPGYKAEYFLTENGLPSNAVQACSADSTGYLWLATRRGLCRYDGYIFQPSPNVRGNLVSMNTAKNGEFTIYDNNTGLHRFNPYSGYRTGIANTNFSDADPNNDHYNNLFTDDEGRIWCSDFRNAKYYTAGSKQEKRFAISGFNNSNDRIAFFANPLPGKVWVASINGLFIWDKSYDSLRRNENPLLSYRSYSAAATIGNDTVALASGNSIYLVKSSANKVISKTIVDITTDDQIISITAATKNSATIIIAASRGQVYCSNKSLSAYTPVFSTSSTGSSINSIYAGATHHIWVCTNHGLVKLTPGNDAIINYTLPDGNAQEDHVTSILRSVVENHFYIGTSAGRFYHTDFANWNRIGLPAKTIINHLSYCNGKVLLSTTSGLYQYADGRVAKIFFKKEYDHAVFKKAMVTPKEVWLLPSELPVVALKKATLQIDSAIRVNDSPVFSASNLWNDIAADDKGNIFLAGWMPESYGLAIYDTATSSFTGIARRTADEKLFIGDYYNRIARSGQFNLLVSGYGGFNAINDSGKVTKIISINDHPLANEHVEGIAAMPDRTIWFGTEEGIQVWNPVTDNTLLITTLNGLPYNNALYAFEPVSDKMLAVGFNRVVSLIDTKTLFNSAFINKLALSKVLVNGTEKFITGNELEVLPNERNITLFFSALNFASNKNVQYWYRINRDEWQLLGNNPSFVFSNFKNGSYTICIKATDDLQNTQDKTLVLQIKALPYYYETLRFKILLPAGIIFLLLFFFWLRIRQLNKWNSFRASLSQDLHDDAGATLSSVNILSTLVAEQEPLSERGALYMRRITDDVKILQLKLDEIIWSLKSNTSNMHQVYSRLVEYGSFIMGAKNIEFAASASPDMDHISLPIKKLRNLFLTAKEALNNIAKHSEASHASLTITAGQQLVSITVSDNGKGIAQQKIHSRNGITGMQKRIKETGGNIRINSSSATGTNIHITLKL
ncbi:sensor histidine kinase [Ferruginibacter sp. HRS2-29]|uniref:sensor histidine kinase n=1 Tax=Ferruginibacter sp. HRS2-29 TaxID=2487334 RepID=UPI0020CD6E67|nr:sensor histidine kinase [Ferruginibacter sp. HRS2-29]MCP9753518.1 hypothetical protein [Ferruginibacter sp. HRS2-29]